MTSSDDTRPRWIPTPVNVEMRKRYPKLSVWNEFRPPKLPMGETLESAAEKLVTNPARAARDSSTSKGG